MSKRTRNRLIIGTMLGVIVVVVVVAIMTFPSGAQNLDLNATLSEIVGNVGVRNTVQENYNPVDNGYILKMVQQLQTQEQSKVRLDLSTGSIVRLGQSTIFSLAQSQAGNSTGLSLLTIELGKMWIVLKGGSIDVKTPSGLASVRGSYMSVWVEPSTNIITEMCLEGHCSFQNNAGTVELTSAQKIISTDPNILPVVQPMDMADIQSWLDNCPEAADIIPTILPLIATDTPTATLEITPTLTATPTATLTPTPTFVGGPAGQTATYSYLLTVTATYATGTVTNTPTSTATVPVRRKTPTPTSVNNPPPPPRPTNTQPPPPPPPPPTNTPAPYP